MSVLAAINLATLIAAAIPSLIQAAESIYGALKGSGSVKKDAVTNGVSLALQAAAAAGAKEAADPDIQAAILKGSSALIDNIVSAMNTARAWPTSGAAGDK